MRNDFESNYLMHWGLKKGAKAPNHKYYERVEKNGKYLYFYTQAEYEAWLHQGNSALESAKNKGKELLDKAKNKVNQLTKDSNSKQTLANTKQNLVNAVNTGYSQTTNLIAMAQKQLTKSNAQVVIDRGNNAVSSILNTTSKAVSKTASNISKNVEKTIKQAGKDTSKVVNDYISKGEKAIKSTLSKASNISTSNATKSYGDKGAGIISHLLATAAKALIIKAAVKVVKAIANEISDRREFNKQQKEREEKEKQDKVKKIDPKLKREAEERAKDYSNDARDTHKENLAEHTDIPQKDTVMSRDEDMMAVNSIVSENEIYKEYEEKAQKCEELWEKYEQTGDTKYLKEFEKLRDEALEVYYNNAGFLNNCANCTLTYDLRRRGYDVDAPWNDLGTWDGTITSWYNLDTEKDVDYWDPDDGERFSEREAQDMVDYMAKQYPDGAYGHFCLTWADGGGHDCVWSKEGGKIVIRDCQTGQVLDPKEYIEKSNDIYYFRADDKELSDRAYTTAKVEHTNQFGEDVGDDYWYFKRRKEYERYK